MGKLETILQITKIILGLVFGAFIAYILIRIESKL